MEEPASDDPLELGLPLSADVPDLESPLSFEPDFDSLLSDEPDFDDFSDFCSPLLRLSLMYQPEPLKTMPAGKMTRCIGLPHSGQNFSGSSLNFCTTSNSWAQAEQR